MKAFRPLFPRVLRGPLRSIRSRRLVKDIIAWVRSLNATEMDLANRWAGSHIDPTIGSFVVNAQSSLNMDEFDRFNRLIKLIGTKQQWSRVHLSPLPPSVVEDMRATQSYYGSIRFLEHAIKAAVTARILRTTIPPSATDLEAPYRELVKLIERCRSNHSFAELASAIASDFAGDIEELAIVNACTT